MLIFRFVDDRGDILTDYDLYLTGGPNYDPTIPPGFFVDRQRNKINPGTLTYFVDYDVCRRGLNKDKMGGRIGFRVVARPVKSADALAFYRPWNTNQVKTNSQDILKPNETLMVEIQLRRLVDATVFRIESNLKPSAISGPYRRESGLIHNVINVGLLTLAQAFNTSFQEVQLIFLA